LENEVQAAFWVVFAGKRNYANWSNTPLSQMALMSFCKMVMGACRFVFLVYVDDRAIYEFREAERRLCQ